MTRYSQNGYVACDSSLIAKFTIPNTGGITINLRKGDVSVVLLDFLSWYHNNVEHLTQADTGGYNCRVIEGSSTTSNHGSGTAADARWNKHPRGAHGTFSKTQKDKINAKLATYAGVIRWGENYSSSSTIDGMHYEINKAPAAVKVQADKIRNAAKPKPPVKPKPPTGSALPVYKNGSRQNSAAKNNIGTDVATLQRFIGSKEAGAADGHFGAKTTAGVKWYQHEVMGLTGKNVDGIAGPKTWAPILKAIK